MLLSEVGPPGVDGPFVVVEYDDEPSLVRLENELSGPFPEGKGRIDAYTRTWDGLAKPAWSPDGSIEVLHRMAGRVAS